MQRAPSALFKRARRLYLDKYPLDGRDCSSALRLFVAEERVEEWVEPDPGAAASGQIAVVSTSSLAKPYKTLVDWLKKIFSRSTRFTHVCIEPNVWLQKLALSRPCTSFSEVILSIVVCQVARKLRLSTQRCGLAEARRGRAATGANAVSSDGPVVGARLLDASGFPSLSATKMTISKLGE